MRRLWLLLLQKYGVLYTKLGGVDPLFRLGVFGGQRSRLEKGLGAGRGMLRVGLNRVSLRPEGCLKVLRGIGNDPSSNVD